MVTSKMRRWRRIFGGDDRTVIVALDHAAAFGTVEGLERPGDLLRQIRMAGADAILTTRGICARFAAEIGDLGVILRVDGGVSALTAADGRGPLQLIHDVDDALRLGADGVGAMGMPGARHEAVTLPYLSELVRQGAAWNVPVMAEMLPGGFEDPSLWWTPENVAHACRIGAELGVDFIKTVYTGEEASFRRVVEQVYVPLVVLGGGRSQQPRELLANIHGAMQAGAKGVAVGRNIFRHPHPDRLTAAVTAIVHREATVDDALKLLS
ncbi:MAG TPA: hypothetical protein ENN99_14855 [Chloroflexi bacterium]|nr:hypothetical protein [Chloroflexota bacterium]